MMLDDDAHAASVDAWMRRAAEGLPSDGLLSAFELAFSALWQRAHRTLGDVTLSAILDRVLIVTSERHPAFSSLEMDGRGIRSVDSLRQGAPALPAAELAAGLRFLLLEFLGVLGNLTGEILTPALHAELANAPIQATHASSRMHEQQRGPPIERKVPEDTKS